MSGQENPLADMRRQLAELGEEIKKQRGMIVRLKSVMFIEDVRIPGGNSGAMYYPAEKYASIRLDTSTMIVCIEAKEGGAQRWVPFARVRECEPMAKEQEGKR